MHEPEKSLAAPMSLTNVVRQFPAGLILGLSAAIYAVSYGALLMAGPLGAFTAHGIAAAIVTAIVGLLVGFFVEERSFVGGPDSNTVSVLATVLAAVAGVVPSLDHRLNLTLALMVEGTLICALLFWVVAHFRLGRLVRFVPMPVMAGFLAATGFAMSSGAFNIVSGAPLTLEGMQALIADPERPELLAGLIIAAALFMLARRFSTAFLIPVMVALCTLAASLALNASWCASSFCNPERWFFAGLGHLPLRAPWTIEIGADDIGALVAALPGLFVVAFVALLTLLISVAGLELHFGREYDLERASKVHFATSALLAGGGGFMQIVSMGRTNLNHALGGERAAAAVAALVCAAILLGGGPLLSILPRPALGGLVLFVGAGMLKRWLWDERRDVTRLDYAQIVFIFLVIVKFGYVVGFVAGVLLSCLAFVMAYGAVSPVRVAGDLGGISSSLLRPEHEAAILMREGARVPVLRLHGHLFFGSAAKVEALFAGLSGRGQAGLVLDLTHVASIDRSAVGSLRRMFRRFRHCDLTFFLVHRARHLCALQEAAAVLDQVARPMFFEHFDSALEAAEDHILRLAREPQNVGAMPDPTGVFAPFCRTMDIAEGEYLCREGEASEAVYFIRSGAFEIFKAAETGEIRIAKVGPGAMIGEMAQYGEGLRTASIRASEKAVVWELDASAQHRMRAQDPALAHAFESMVIRKLAATLTRANRALASFEAGAAAGGTSA